MLLMASLVLDADDLTITGLVGQATVDVAGQYCKRNCKFSQWQIW